MHTKYENNSSTGSWDIPKYVFSTIGDLVSKVKGQGKFWHRDIIDTSYLICEYKREPVKWIHCWNNWHWTLSFLWIWPYWITLGKYKMADISTRNPTHWKKEEIQKSSQKYSRDVNCVHCAGESPSRHKKHMTSYIIPRCHVSLLLWRQFNVT